MAEVLLQSQEESSTDRDFPQLCYHILTKSELTVHLVFLTLPFLEKERPFLLFHTHWLFLHQLVS